MSYIDSYNSPPQYTTVDMQSVLRLDPEHDSVYGLYDDRRNSWRPYGLVGIPGTYPALQTVGEGNRLLQFDVTQIKGILPIADLYLPSDSDKQVPLVTFDRPGVFSEQGTQAPIFALNPDIVDLASGKPLRPAVVGFGRLPGSRSDSITHGYYIEAAEVGAVELQPEAGQPNVADITSAHLYEERDFVTNAVCISFRRLHT